ncbi:trypsin-like serine protease [Amycolatopsis sp. NPDC049159]|uniref:trypsin-like serine protease n=1 Tax=Amycolatopsis sp. NPDC049159 TaxID=3157210 RepID=UPI0033E85D22
MDRTRTAGRTAIGGVLLVTGLLAAVPASAVSHSSVAADGTYGFTAKLTMDGRACSGVLVAPDWVATAASCFPENPQGGAPAKATTAVVGRTDLTGSAGHSAAVTGLVLAAGRDLALARLAAPITDVVPISLSATAPAAGEKLRVAGFGRTDTEWVPDKLHSAVFTAGANTATTASLTGDAGADTCRGDAGGPAFREVSGRAELVGVSSASWQHGCFGETETRQGSTAARTDDVVSWIRQTVLAPVAKGVGHTIVVSWNGLPAADNASYAVYGSTTADVPVDAAHRLTTTSSLSFTQPQLPAKQTRYYRVVATPAAGPASAPTAVVSATTPLSKGTDFTGDGLEDVGAVYDFKNARTGLYVWPSLGPGSAESPILGTPALKWDSGNGAVNAAQARWLSGDFNGDGRSDFAMVYDYLNNSSTIWLWYANAAGGFDAQGVKWDSANFSPSKARFVAGDFDGDGRTDIGAAYDNGNASMSFLTWHATATGIDAPVTQWTTAAGVWNIAQSTWVAGDFTGDGRADLASFYDYRNNSANLFLWTANAAGKFDDKGVKWNGLTFTPAKARFVTGDFDGDGRIDIGAAYDNGNADTTFSTWHATGDGFDAPVTKWDSGAGTWSWAKSQWTAPDIDGDGRADVIASYDYGNSNTGLFYWHTAQNGALEDRGGKWNSNGTFSAAQAVFL